jgi:hypothetical protein
MSRALSGRLHLRPALSSRDLVVLPSACGKRRKSPKGPTVSLVLFLLHPVHLP